jgi:hypothetical protein
MEKFLAMSRSKTLNTVAPPRGMSERQAAAYWGVSPGTFRKMRRLGLAPPPMDLPGIDRRIYDRLALDRAIESCGGVAPARVTDTHHETSADIRNETSADLRDLL